MIFDGLKRKLAARNRERSATRTAERAFRDAYPSKKLIRGMTSIFHDVGSSLVVQTCDDWGGIPPRRSWWLVCADGSCRELSLEEANRHRLVPAWR